MIFLQSKPNKILLVARSGVVGRMKVFVQLGAAVLAALAIVPTPGTEGAAISYGKRVRDLSH